MESQSPKSRYGIFIIIIITAIVIVSILATLWMSDPLNQTMLEKWIDQIGVLGWLVVAVLQFVQIVIAPIPAEPIHIMSGTLYGTWGGLILNILGSIPASILVFWIGRKYGKSLLYKLFGKSKIDKISILHQTDKLEIATIILFLIPAAPNDIVSYLCGLSSMKALRFVVIATIARIPVNLMCTMIGDSLQEGEWELAVIIAAAMVLVAFIGIKYKDKFLGNKKKENAGEIHMKKVLLSEGSSLTSRETITSLANSGFCIDILSSSKLPLSMFSKWKNKMIQTVNVNEQPMEYLNHVSSLLRSGEYATIIPTHEAAWLFSEGIDYLPIEISVPVATSKAFHSVQSKISFAELADALNIPRPKWQLLNDEGIINIPYPYWLKADFGTAGRSVYKVCNQLEITQAINHLSNGENRLMAQENIEGQYGQVQAVFDHGRMLAVHTTVQQGLGAGGSAAARLSVDYPETREHICRIGSHLNWHGSLTVDFIYSDGLPYYIECNPRMIEPANAAKAGVNFAEILINLSTGGQLPQDILIGKAGVKTHSSMALLLGSAEKTNSRKDLLKTFWNSVACKGNFSESIEVLTPFRNDPLSIIPLLAIFFQLLINPHKVKSIAQHTVGDYCVLPKTIKAINS